MYIYTQNNLHRDTCMSYIYIYIYIYACMYADWGVGFGAFGLGIWGVIRPCFLVSGLGFRV